MIATTTGSISGLIRVAVGLLEQFRIPAFHCLVSPIPFLIEGSLTIDGQLKVE